MDNIKQLNSKIDSFNLKFDELTVFLVDQFGKIAKEMATKDDLAELRAEMATKAELHNEISTLRGEMVTKTEFYNEIALVRSEMVTKSKFHQEMRVVKLDLSEVKEIVQRLDKRTHEDIRATMKDVEKIKTYLVKRGHQI